MEQAAMEPKIKKEKPKISIHLHIPKEHHLHKGFNMKGYKVGGKHHFGLHGKVSSLREDEYGKELGLEIEKIDGITGGKDESLGGQMKALKASRKLGKSEPIDEEV